MVLTIDELERWVQFGAAWRLRRSDGGRITVDMLTCTGELVERRDSDDPELISYVNRVGGAPAAPGLEDTLGG